MKTKNINRNQNIHWAIPLLAAILLLFQMQGCYRYLGHFSYVEFKEKNDELSPKRTDGLVRKPIDVQVDPDMDDYYTQLLEKAQEKYPNLIAVEKFEISYPKKEYLMIRGIGVFRETASR